MGAASKGDGPKLDWFIREIKSVDLDPNTDLQYAERVRFNRVCTYVPLSGPNIESDMLEPISLRAMVEDPPPRRMSTFTLAPCTSSSRPGSGGVDSAGPHDRPAGGKARAEGAREAPCLREMGDSACKIASVEVDVAGAAGAPAHASTVPGIRATL